MASGNSHKRQIDSLDVKSEDSICPICLESPHNGVLLHCSSYDKGCRPFICDTDHYHSNCLDRFKAAYKLPNTSAKNSTSNESICPLCRGAVRGWVVIDEARASLNLKRRCCEERECSYIGNYPELQAHAKERHPNARPSEIDPARKHDWENFQQSNEIIDVLSTIHNEVPHGIVLGDYVIEYGDDSGDEYDDFPGDEGNWWTSCILYQVFDNFRASRSRRRSMASESRRIQERLADVASNGDEGSISSRDFGEYQFDDDSDDEIVGGGGENVSGVRWRGGSGRRSYRRRRPRLHDP